MASVPERPPNTQAQARQMPPLNRRTTLGTDLVNHTLLSLTVWLARRRPSGRDSEEFMRMTPPGCLLVVNFISITSRRDSRSLFWNPRNQGVPPSSVASRSGCLVSGIELMKPEGSL